MLFDGKYCYCYCPSHNDDADAVPRKYSRPVLAHALPHQDDGWITSLGEREKEIQQGSLPTRAST